MPGKYITNFKRKCDLCRCPFPSRLYEQVDGRTLYLCSRCRGELTDDALSDQTGTKEIPKVVTESVGEFNQIVRKLQAVDDATLRGGGGRDGSGGRGDHR